ncbi:unnamed protein product [Symbiodinium sp. KB8]|nr:unnamed protein product [Symbiodinium sp. KB8]
MSFIRDASGMEWERIEDSEDEAESTTTVLPEEVPMTSQMHSPSPSREASSGRWTPTMHGALAGSGQRGRGTARHLNWEEAPARASSWQQPTSGWPASDQDWLWHEWSDQSWNADPWSDFLDSQRPGWRSRRYANWTEGSDASSQWSMESPEDDVVPLPRLLEKRGEMLQRATPLEVLDYVTSCVRLHLEQLKLRKFEEDGDVQLRDVDRAGKNHGDGAPDKGYLKLHNSFPPEFKARPGSRLMQQMRERAGKILNHLTVADVATDGGVELIKREMEKSPIIRLLEHKEVDRKRQKFMKLSRYPKESLESFINRASIYRHENDQCQNYKVGTKFYLGHLLDAAKLSRKDEALIKTASQGLHDEGRVVNAMLDLAEQLEGLPGFPIGKGEPDMPDEDKYLVQKRAGDREFPPRRDDRSGRFQHGGKGSRGNRLRAKWKQVFHTILEDIDSSDGQASEPAAEEDEPDQDDGTGGEEESASGETEAASDLPAEVYAQEYKAKKRVNEIKQMRQYYKKDPEKTKAWIKEQQKREPCFLCQKLGHWSQECPLRQKKGASNSRSSHAVHVTSVTSGPASSEPGQWDMLASLAAYTKSDPELPDDVQQCQGFHECLVTIDHTTLDHETFWSMRELHSSLILDLGCMKSVAGTKWVNQHIQRLRGLGRWMKAVKGHESFRFGDGHELCSEYAFVFEATVLGVRVILKVSVVPGECPPLLSKPACSQMGMIIDTELHTVSSRKLKIKNYGLHQTYGGHYALPIAEFTEAMQPIHAPDIPQHLEAIPVYVMQSDVQVPAPPDTDVMRPDATEEDVSRRDRERDQPSQEDDEDFANALSETSGWDRVEMPSEAPEERPRIRKSTSRTSFATRSHLRKSRSKSADSKGKSSDGEKARQPKATVDKNRKQTRSPATRKMPSTPGASSTAPPTPAKPTTIAVLKAQAEELEEQLWPYMDPHSIEVEGSKATRAYWVERVRVLEEELKIAQGPWPMQDVPNPDADKPTLRGEPAFLPIHTDEDELNLEDPPPPKGRPATRSGPPVAKAKAVGKSQKVKALTDHQANFPTLSNRYSDDLVINVALSLTCQMLTFKWKQLVWMLRIRRAVEMEFGDSSRWRRNPRWLMMMMMGKQIASLWGHLGAARQLCNDPKLNYLMKGNALPDDEPFDIGGHDPDAMAHKGKTLKAKRQKYVPLWEFVEVDASTAQEHMKPWRDQATGDKYDYIYFEGASGSLSRELRSTLAKLHVVLGHVSSDKLKRMLHLNGAKDHIINAAGDLRCQVCQMVTGPKAPPKAAYDRPQRFNQRVVADAFFIWDSDNVKYAVIHAVDAFSLYQAASMLPSVRSDRVAHFLKNHWIGVFGPPEIVMTDAGAEFAKETESLLRAFDIQHDIVPPTAKWRMGLAERHGAVLKLLVMKTIKSTTAKGYSETKECVLASVAARNRQMRVGGFSPAQIVLGKDVAIPSSLLQQLSSGHFRYVMNQDLAFDDARRRNEEIRYAASQAFIWADGHETLRKAINSRSRHPRLEMLYEGAVIYFYDPPGSRRGLPKRLQDQVSWTGPAVVVALERTSTG